MNEENAEKEEIPGSGVPGVGAAEKGNKHIPFCVEFEELRNKYISEGWKETRMREILYKDGEYVDIFEAVLEGEE